MIWGAFKRTYVCDMISMAIAAAACVIVSGLGFDVAAIPAAVALGLVTFLSLAVYRQRYGRL